MIGPTSIPPTRPIGCFSEETVTTIPVKGVDPEAGLKKIRRILAIEPDQFWHASKTVDEKDSSYSLSLYKNCSDEFSQVEVTSRGEIKTRKSKPIPNSNTTKFDCWKASISDSNDPKINELINEACAHVRNLWKQYYKAHTSRWERLCNLFFRR